MSYFIFAMHAMVMYGHLMAQTVPDLKPGVDWSAIESMGGC